MLRSTRGSLWAGARFGTPPLIRELGTGDVRPCGNRWGLGRPEHRVRARAVGARVALVEKARVGGKTSGSACWPSKGLVQAAEAGARAQGTARFGIKTATPQIDFAAVMANVHARSPMRLQQRESAEILAGRRESKFIMDRRRSRRTTRWKSTGSSCQVIRFVIATGSRAAMPDDPRACRVRISRLRLDLVAFIVAASLTVITTEPVGIEFAQCFARLGSKVTVLTESAVDPSARRSGSLVAGHETT